jgi:hypothetical protein
MRLPRVTLHSCTRRGSARVEWSSGANLADAEVPRHSQHISNIQQHLQTSTELFGMSRARWARGLPECRTPPRPSARRLAVSESESAGVRLAPSARPLLLILVHASGACGPASQYPLSATASGPASAL